METDLVSGVQIAVDCLDCCLKTAGFEDVRWNSYTDHTHALPWELLGEALSYD
jgi:hypothetical protein